VIIGDVKVIVNNTIFVFNKDRLIHVIMMHVNVYGRKSKVVHAN